MEAQVFWLEQHRGERWILRLREAVDEAARALARFPAMGAPVILDPRRGAAPPPLRKLVLRRVPFVVWYAVDDDSVWLLRLFHARQKRPHAKHPRRRVRR